MSLKNLSDRAALTQCNERLRVDARKPKSVNAIYRTDLYLLMFEWVNIRLVDHGLLVLRHVRLREEGEVSGDTEHLSVIVQCVSAASVPGSHITKTEHSTLIGSMSRKLPSSDTTRLTNQYAVFSTPNK